jgi:hypothetical protein
MNSDGLHELRESCEKLQLMCKHNLNRILECMTKHPNACKHLETYAKKCIIMEKLCDYTACNCCNADSVSMLILKEHKQKCNDMVKVCKDLKNILPKEVCDYIRCDKMINVCGPDKKKSKKVKKKR